MLSGCSNVTSTAHVTMSAVSGPRNCSQDHVDASDASRVSSEGREGAKFSVDAHLRSGRSVPEYVNYHGFHRDTCGPWSRVGRGRPDKRQSARHEGATPSRPNGVRFGACRSDAPSRVSSVRLLVVVRGPGDWSPGQRSPPVQSRARARERCRAPRGLEPKGVNQLFANQPRRGCAQQDHRCSCSRMIP